MTAELQGILLKEGCLLFLDVSQGQKLLEAIRVAESRGPAPNPPTVQDYADRCGDIRKTIPIMGGREVIGSHLVNGQEALTPPPELQRVHELIIVIFQEWAKSEPSVSSTQEMNIALGRLSPETLDTLRSSGCLSSQN